MPGAPESSWRDSLFAIASWRVPSRRRDIRVILLAAGRGTRLQPLTDSRPKCLLTVAGRPLVIRAVAQLAERGLRRFTIVDGYRGEMIRSALTAEFPADWFHFVRNDDWETTGNACSLHLARKEEEESLFLLDGDIAFDMKVLDRMMTGPEPNRLAVRSSGDLGSEEMKVTLDVRGNIADLGKEIPPGEAAGESVGLEVFSASAATRLFEILDRRVHAGPGLTEFYEAAFVELIHSGEVLSPVDLGDCPCVEIDTADDLSLANRIFTRIS